VNERKALVGSTEAFDVLIPGVVSGSPSLTFRRDGAEVAGAGFAVKRAADSCTAINATDLTGTFAAGVGLQGPVYGRAYLLTAQDGIFPVQIDELTTTTARMSEPLPRSVVITEALPASLVWAWWSAAIPAAVTATETGDSPVDWWVTYTENRGTAVGTLASQRVSGVLHVVAGKFATGLSDEALNLYWGHVIPRAQVGHLSHAGPIEAARSQMVTHIRMRLNASTSGRREDDINGADFLQAHAAWAASHIIKARNPELSATLLAEAMAQTDKALASVSWYDPEGTGEGTTGAPAQKAALLFNGANLPLRSATPRNAFDYRIGRARS
jgi:hypothetical protein